LEVFLPLEHALAVEREQRRVRILTATVQAHRLISTKDQQCRPCL
jgi:hypothetical protein